MEAKHHFFVIGVAGTVIILGLAIVVFGYASILSMMPATSTTTYNGSAATVVPFTKLMKGSNATITTRVNYLITSSDQLKALWKFINASSTPPTIDFKTSAVLAVFAGKATSAEIAVAKVEDSSARLVSIKIAKPEPTCPQPTASVSPYEIVTVPATSLPLAHKDIVSTIGCRD
ncbi:MAG: hypothetical protein WAV50_00385 [Minisyncoccia bacterium]